MCGRCCWGFRQGWQGGERGLAVPAAATVVLDKLLPAISILDRAHGALTGLHFEGGHAPRPPPRWNFLRSFVHYRRSWFEQWMMTVPHRAATSGPVSHNVSHSFLKHLLYIIIWHLHERRWCDQRPTRRAGGQA